jgi:predicted O-methyltransferase YrrM
MAAGLQPGGSIVTCELNPRHVEIARRHIEHAGLSDVIEVIEGPADETIGRLEGPFDLVFIDANKAGYVDYYEGSLPLLADGGLIVADNTLRDGRVLDEEVDDETAGMKRFNEHILADDRVTVVLLTVRDGMTLIRKTG